MEPSTTPKKNSQDLPSTLRGSSALTYPHSAHQQTLHSKSVAAQGPTPILKVGPPRNGANPSCERCSRRGLVCTGILGIPCVPCHAAQRRCSFTGQPKRELLAGETEMPSISSYYQTKPVPTKDSETVPAAAKRSLTNSKLKRKSFDGMDSIGSEPKPKALKREETNKVPTVISQSKDRLPTIDFRTKLNKTNGSRSFCGAQTLTRKSTDVSQFVSSNLASKSLNDFLISQDKLSTRLVDDPVKEKIREAIEKIVKEKLDSMLDEIIDECFLSVAATLSSS
ncbi:hypothetical protein NLI96_g10335 [Meripilus lineatus]|uniref:Zn(2)-C6 fungal-type domain-containing protein n=1 Tax=Meripilus lineatus TaxID=2056292 RepID=A0AAD5Y9D9_9APHY|nr:hypothetical protein NLI96_g10335 [Physisporinus lineatus]